MLRVIVAATVAVLCTLGLLVVGQAARAADAPTVTSVSPNRGIDRGGTHVTITGTGFTNATAVDIDTGSVLFTVVSDTEITATTISHADGTVDVTVVTPDGTSAVTPADQFTFIPGYRITGISPTSGPVGGGNTITITGTAFTGTVAVLFQQSAGFHLFVAHASFTVDSDTQITAIVPPTPQFSGNAQISLLNPLGPDPAAPRAFYRYVGPTVTSINFPAFGLVTGGTQVTVKGSGFTSGATVQFGSTPATSVTVLSSTSLTAVAPPGSPGVVDVTVTTPDGITSSTSTGDQFTYIALPTITGVSPGVGPAAGGNTVTITGTGFQNIFGFPGVTTVDFGSVPAPSFTVDSDTQLTATVPAGSAGTVDVTELSWLGATTATSAADQYAYLPVPAVTGVSPGAGPSAGGNPVTVTGSGFTDAGAVTFGTVPAASFTVNSDTSITATVPAGAVGIDDVTVTTPGGTSAVSATDQYTYAPMPAVTGVSPGSGLSVGGNTVTVTGTGFTGASAVSFGAVPAASFTVDSDSSITAVVPAGAVGIDDVTVTTPGGTSAVSAADQYVYHPTCTTTITGPHSGNITVSSGLTCLVNASQAGSVTVEAGAALSVTGSAVSGSVTATDPAGITYCGSTEAGSLTVTGATGPVVLSGALPDGTVCTADTISGAVTITGASAPVAVTGLTQRGAVTLENDTADVTLDASRLNGGVLIENDTATAPAVITVSGNTVTGSLSCTGNNPAPTDNGSINTVSGTVTDQCTGIAER